MTKTKERTMIDEAVNHEIAIAEELAASGNPQLAFHHLERAHFLRQASTYHHTRIHWRMWKLGFTLGSIREIWGQFIRIVGAATKTPFGIYPRGNTGGADVWFFRPMQIPPDLQKVLDDAGHE
jgi:hypothetical protein